MDAAIVMVVGGFVTASAGLVFDAQSEKRRVAQLVDTLSQDMCCDLERAITIYDGLVQNWRDFGVIDAALLDELKDTCSTYFANQEWLGLFDEAGVSKAIFHYYRSCSELQLHLLEMRAQLLEVRTADEGIVGQRDVLAAEVDAAAQCLIWARTEAAELLGQLESAPSARAA